MSYTTGAGYQIQDPRLNGGVTVTDPESIDMDGIEIFTGMHVGLGGVQPVKGFQTKTPAIKVVVPGNMATVPDLTTTASQTTTIINPAGTTKTLATWLVTRQGPNLRSNDVSGNVKTVTFQGAAANTDFDGF